MTDDLENKRRQIAELQTQLDKLTAEKTKLEAETRDAEVSAAREHYCVKVVCPICNGSGNVFDGEGDIEGCDRCNGNGFLWAVRYDDAFKTLKDVEREDLVSSLSEWDY